MAVAPTIDKIAHNAYLVTWNLTTAAPTGSALGPKFAGCSDKTLQAVAAATGSATLKLQGSLDGTNYGTLHQGDLTTTHSYTASQGPTLVAENVAYIRPKLTTAGTGAIWHVYLLAKLVS